jgi:hypothetical protein
MDEKIVVIFDFDETLAHVTRIILNPPAESSLSTNSTLCATIPKYQISVRGDICQSIEMLRRAYEASDRVLILIWTAATSDHVMNALPFVGNGQFMYQSLGMGWKARATHPRAHSSFHSKYTNPADFILTDEDCTKSFKEWGCNKDLRYLRNKCRVFQEWVNLPRFSPTRIRLRTVIYDDLVFENIGMPYGTSKYIVNSTSNQYTHIIQVATISGEAKQVAEGRSIPGGVFTWTNAIINLLKEISLDRGNLWATDYSMYKTTDGYDIVRSSVK